MYQEGTILIDPTRPDTLLRAEVEALRAICEEPLRVFRRAANLDGPGWIPLSGDAELMYQLVAIRKVVWRGVWSGVMGQPVAYEEIDGTLLDKAGYMWQRERGRWDRLPAPDESVHSGRIEIGETLKGGDVRDVVMGGA